MTSAARYSWQEPFRGAVIAWRESWWYKALWALAVFIVCVGCNLWRYGEDVLPTTLTTLNRIWWMPLVVFLLPLLIFRRVDLYEDKIVILQGRARSTYRLNELRTASVSENSKPAVISIRLRSGGIKKVLLAHHVDPASIRTYFSNSGLGNADT
jgi:hypothetical protein